MRSNLRRARLFLYLLCSGILLSGIVLADDQTTSSETYGAYPGAPTNAPTPTPSSGQSGLAYAYPTAPTAYPTQPSTANTMPAGQAAMATGTGTAAAYPGAPSGTGATAVSYAQAPPVAQQNTLLPYNIQAIPPSAAYYGGTYVPWASFYQGFPADSPALWVATFAGWSWYANCPLGSWTQELVFVPATGTMKIYELYPDGTTRHYNYGWATPGYKYKWFFADTPGRHIDVVTISDSPSNYVVLDVA